MRRTILPPTLNDLTEAKLAEYFEDTWRLYEWLFSSIADDAGWYLQPDPLRNPLIFYLGHPAAFYVNKLRAVGAITEPVDPVFDSLFEIGVDPELPEELDAVLHGIEWPSLERVWKYRQLCYDVVRDTLPRLVLEWPTADTSPLWALLMGIEHDRIHFETSSVLLRQLPLQYLRRPEGWTYAPTEALAKPQLEFIPVKQGATKVGKDSTHPTFGWDNEYGHREVPVEEFQVSRCLVSNSDFAEFIVAGGYLDERNWEPDGWAWRTRDAAQAPRFWSIEDGTVMYRAMFDVVPLPADWPAEVNYHEAMAYCHWRGQLRLPTEAEWCRLRDEFGGENDTGGGETEWNLHLKHGSPESVTANPSDHSGGICDVQGNVWQWLSTVFEPLPGFRTTPLYPDFSAPFFTPQHMMMLGGSWATTGTAASRYYRLWFRKHFYQHAGFRVVKARGMR